MVAGMRGNYLFRQLLAILIDRVFLTLQIHLVLGVQAQLELEILDLQILDFAGLDRTFRRVAAFNFFMVLRICQARTEIASHASPAMARMAGLE
jgi:hypothetical protein